jgi:uncharacterized membrane protein
MITEDQILTELQKINQRLAKKNIFYTAWDNFVAGFFHSFGNLVGTLLIILALIYITSRFNVTKIFTDSFEQFMSQINWTKIVPQPRIQIDPNLFQ